MSSDNILSQDEIDALLGKDSGGSEESVDVNLLPDEKDALGEIGNITMGSASTTLSMLLNQKVNITSPKVTVTNYNDLIAAFTVPYLTIKVDFIDGLQGFNLLVIKLEDSMVIADLMMGGDGSKKGGELTDIEISAASEAMNQMIGTAATSLATMFSKTVNISPPVTEMIKDGNVSNFMVGADSLVVVSFQMTIGELVDTEIMQIIGLETAKEEAELLFAYAQDMGTVQPAETALPEPEPEAKRSEPEPESTPSEQMEQPWEEVQVPSNKVNEQSELIPDNFSMSAGPQYNQQKLDLLLDIPLKVSVILGRTKRAIKEVLNYSPGTVVELSALVDEPVDILVNGTLVAKGEVVVVNDNFGVKITSIISPSERVKYLSNR